MDSRPDSATRAHALPCCRLVLRLRVFKLKALAVLTEFASPRPQAARGRARQRDFFCARASPKRNLRQRCTAPRGASARLSAPMHSPSAHGYSQGSRAAFCLVTRQSRDCHSARASRFLIRLVPSFRAAPAPVSASTSFSTAACQLSTNF